jgi:hypothetical protein
MPYRIFFSFDSTLDVRAVLETTPAIGAFDVLDPGNDVSNLQQSAAPSHARAASTRSTLLRGGERVWLHGGGLNSHNSANFLEFTKRA